MYSNSIVTANISIAIEKRDIKEFNNYLFARLSLIVKELMWTVPRSYPMSCCSKYIKYQGKEWSF